MTVFGDMMQETSSIDEGKSFSLGIEIRYDHCIASLPDLIVRIDSDFSGDYSEDETHLYRSSGSWYHSDLIIAGSGLVADDGPSPGNQTPSDDVTWEVIWGSEREDGSVTVRNTVPAFPVPVSVTSGKNDDDEFFYRVSAVIRDAAINHEVFTLIAEWSDGVVSEVEVDGSEFPVVGSDRLIAVDRVFADDEERPGLYPALITIQDDDQGETTADLRKLDVLTNTDDDDENGRVDLFDYNLTQADPDIVEFPIGDFKNSLMNPDTGYFYLSHPFDHVRIWDSATKERLYDRYVEVPYEVPSAQPLAYLRIPYEGQDSIFIEGIYPGNSAISLSWTFSTQLASEQGLPYSQWPFHNSVYGGTVHITSWGIDYDVDSDNNQGSEFPENSIWEEYLEDNDYAIGKMLCVPEEGPFAAEYIQKECENTQHAPSRLRLPAGLDAANDNARVVFETDLNGDSGEIELYAWAAVVNPDGTGSPQLEQIPIDPGESYTLSELNYDPVTGGITVWLNAKSVNSGHATKTAIDAGSKPVDQITAKVTGLNIPGAGEQDLEDTIRWMNVEPDSYYEHLNRRDVSGLNPRHGLNGEQMRTFHASELVYTASDGPNWTLKRLNAVDMQRLGIPENVIQAIISGSNPSGLKLELYREHVTGKLILAFAGTEIDTISAGIYDFIANVLQADGSATAQYVIAMEIANTISDSKYFEPSWFMYAGHSLGGGLASAAYAVSGLPADTYNSAGLNPEILYLPPDPLNPGKVVERYDGSIERLADAASFIDAYYMEHDLLNHLQDNPGIVNTVPGIPDDKRAFLFGLLHNALGKRIQMDGPFEIVLDGGFDWSDLLSLGPMLKSHTCRYVYYGIMVEESPFQHIDDEDKIVWNILGELPEQPE